MYAGYNMGSKLAPNILSNFADSDMCMDNKLRFQYMHIINLRVLQDSSVSKYLKTFPLLH